MRELVHLKCHKDRGGCGTDFRVRTVDGRLNRKSIQCPCCGDWGPQGNTINKLLGKYVIDRVESPHAGKEEEATA